MANKLFTTVQVKAPPTNVFDLTHDHKTSFPMGTLVPVCVVEAVPGDKFHINSQSLIRLAPMVAPVMHRIDATIHYFFVPNRLNWEGWEEFITNTPTGGVLPAFPYITVNDGINPMTRLLEWMGVPTADNADQTQSRNISAMAFASFQRIYNEYYRDQNLETELDIDLVDGNNNANAALRTVRNRAWEHDYFTSALPFAQKGSPVPIPIANFEDVYVRAVPAPPTRPDGTLISVTATSAGPDNNPLGVNAEDPSAGSGIVTPNFLYAQTSALAPNSTTINDLRTAIRTQEYLEKNARGGSRLSEWIRVHFNVVSSDARLQRPEYITGVKTPVTISEVLNTTGTDELPQGNMAGHGLSVVNGNYGSYFCEEHGYIIGIMSIMPKTAYQQGIPKHFLKIDDPFQFYTPEFANIGEQQILNEELYAYTATADGVFGYIPRYTEYKYHNNYVSGEFRSSLNFWHMGRIFATQPALNAAFITSDPTTRIFAVETDVDHCYVHVLNSIKAIRRMPKFGTPTF